MVMSSSTTMQTGFLRSGPILPSADSSGSTAVLPISSEPTRAGWKPRPVAAFAVIQVSPTPRHPNIAPHVALPHTFQRGRAGGLRRVARKPGSVAKTRSEPDLASPARYTAPHGVRFHEACHYT